MHILVTGANGQLGSTLLKQTHEFIHFTGLGRKQLDITDQDAIHQMISLLKPDVIINTAAYTAVDKAESDQEQAYLINETGTSYLAKAAKCANIPLFHLSTDYVFDGFKNQPYVETDRPNPTSVYGASKLAGEVAALKCCQQTLILRTSWVFSEREGNFFTTMFKLAMTRNELKVVNDQLSGPTSTQQITNVLITLAERLHANGSLPWGIYHFSGEPGVSRFGFVQELLKIMSRLKLKKTMPLIEPVSSDYFPSPTQRPKNSIMSSDKLRHLIGDLDNNWQHDVFSILNSQKPSLEANPETL